MRFRFCVEGVLCAVTFALVVPRLNGAQDLAVMAKDAHPAFEVATVKPTDPKDENQGFHLRGREVEVENETVLSMLMACYSLQPRQIVDAPEWVGRERFDIKGVANLPGAPVWPQQQQMIQKLLADRFGLRFHMDSREMTVYALRVSKGGPRLTPAVKGVEGEDQTGDGGHMRYTSNSMQDFATDLNYRVDRPVVDQTGLSGRYDFALRWRPEGAPADDPNASQSLFTAMPEQLGLRLDAVKAPAPVLVIEHIERPSAD